MKVFWSWQSDAQPKENRWFIRDALVDAIKSAANALAVTEAERPEIDQDTLGARAWWISRRQFSGRSQRAQCSWLMSRPSERLKVNLGAELVERAAAIPVIGVEARPEERSIWAHAVQDIPFHEGLGVGLPRKVVVPQGPRSYARFIPAGWTNGPPSVTAVEAWNEFAKLPPMEGGSAGSFGPSEEGYVRFWGASLQGGDYQASNVAMFFEKTGELWVLHGTALDPDGERLYLRVGAVLKHWSLSLASANRFFDHFGASPVRKVELGVTQMREARWLLGSSTLSLPISRKPGVAIERQDREWTNTQQVAFLRVSYNELRNAFSLEAEDESAFEKTIRQADPERFQ